MPSSMDVRSAKLEDNKILRQDNDARGSCRFDKSVEVALPAKLLN